MADAVFNTLNMICQVLQSYEALVAAYYDKNKQADKELSEELRSKIKEAVNGPAV